MNLFLQLYCTCSSMLRANFKVKICENAAFIISKLGLCYPFWYFKMLFFYTLLIIFEYYSVCPSFVEVISSIANFAWLEISSVVWETKLLLRWFIYL